jgi:hypothetical protein
MNRRRVLGVALAATVALVLWTRIAPDDAGDAPPAAARDMRETRGASGASVGSVPAARAPLRLADRTATAAEPVDRALVLPQRSPPAGGAPANLFSAPRRAPPPQAVAAAAPPPPVAPPLPFTYGGRLVVDGETAWLLVDAGRTQIVRTGDTLGEFTLRTASDSALGFVHLPTGLETGLSIDP